MDRYLDYIDTGKKIELIIRTPNGAVRFASFFEEQNDKCILISTPKNKHIKFNFPTGQILELYAYTRGGVFKLKCRLLAINEKNCELSLPFGVENIQRREYIRVNMGINIIIKLLPSQKTTLKTKTKNISAKGANVLLDIDISKYSKVELTLLFPEKTIKTIAKVIKIKPVMIDSTKYYSTSFMFVCTTNRETDFIVKKCFEFESAQRRKFLDNKI